MRAALETIGQKIARGTIPRELPLVAEGAWGVGRDCGACDGTILPSEIEVIGHFRRHDSQTFHVACFFRWWRIVAASERQ
jgi:hypothetical protein